MGIFDSLFGGGNSDIANEVGNSAWGGSQSINYAVNSGQDLLNNALANSKDYLTGAEGRGQDYLQQGFDRSIGYVEPWNTAGKNALQVYASLLGLPGYETTFSPESYLRKTPGYLWQLGQGQKALDASAAGRGMLLSGPQRQASQQYGQNLASTYYDKLMNQIKGVGDTGVATGQTMGNWSNQLGLNQANLARMTASDLANLENSIAGQRVGLQKYGAEGTVNAFDKVAQGQVAQDAANQAADQAALKNILGLVGTVGGIATAPLTGGTSLLGSLGSLLGIAGGGGSGGGYTPTWNNTLANFNASSYGR